MRDDLADRYLAVAPHFSLHWESSDAVLLFSDARSLRLRGPLNAGLVPLLDGRFTGRQILERMNNPQAAGQLESLAKQGLVVGVTPQAEISRQAFWSASGRDPAATEERLGQYSVAVQGLRDSEASGTRSAAAVLGNLIGSGLGVDGAERARLLVLLADDYLDPALLTAIEGAGNGRTILPMKLGGQRALLGPLLGGESGGCAHCLVRRLAEHRPKDALVRQADRALRPARDWTAASLALAQATAASEILRIALGDEQGLGMQLLSVDTTTGERLTHRHWKFPDCPACGRPRDPGAAVTTQPICIDAVRSAVVDADIGGWRTITAEQALERLEPLVSNLTGIVASIDEAPGFDEGLFVYNADQTNPTAVDPLRNRRVGTPAGASGKGMTPTQARVSCLAEAVERYSGGWVGNEARRPARLADLGEAAWHPHRLLLFSERQYRDRAKLNQSQSSLHFIPEPFDEQAEIEWTPVWSLTRQRLAWLPTRFCYYRYEAPQVPGDHDFCHADSNGCASGATQAEAILQGLLELVERDAVAIWWYNRLTHPGIALEGINDAFVDQMLSAYARRGRDIHLLDLTTDNGIPAVVALSSLKDTGGRILMGFGAHADPRIAAERALTELNQLRLLGESQDEDQSKGGDEKDPEGREMRRWLAEATLETEPYLRPASGVPRKVSEMSRLEATSIEEAVAGAQRRFDSLGLEMLVLDYGRADLPLACVKVVIPGMRHFWGRRGPGRLYEVAVQLDWRETALQESELNPLNFVF